MHTASTGISPSHFVTRRVGFFTTTYLFVSLKTMNGGPF